MKPLVDIQNFTGAMNTDDPNESIGKGEHKYSKNITWRGKPGDMRPEGVMGTTLIPFNAPAGTEECIGRFWDEKRGRIFSYIYNSNGTHSIRQYTINPSGTGAIVSIIQIGAGTDGDILGFTLNGKIYAVKMLYGDDEQGDTLHWNNSQKKLCQVNIKKALAGTYGTIKRAFIEVAKPPAMLPPAVVYENDATVTVNNLRKKLFLIRTRPRFLNKEKPVYSAISAMPLPINYMDTAIDKDPTKNCRIAIVIPTGDVDVTDIEVAAVILPESSVTPGDEITGWFTIANLNKLELSISSNDLYTLRFYNNQVYLPCDPVDTSQLQDLVPLEANGLEFLNGNVPVYGGIKEGFNKTVILGSSAVSAISQRTTQLPYLFVASQSGDSGFGTGNIHAIVLGAPVVGDVFNIYTTGATITFTCTVATTANVITGLSAAAVIAGFTVVSSDTENLVITKTSEVLQRVLSVPVTRAVTDSFVYDRNSRYNFAVEYLDEFGRTIGSETNTSLPIQTINYTETGAVPNITKVTVTISNRPPITARYFHITRSKNLSKLTKLEWVSDRTYKDAEYAYISIENLRRYVKANPSAAHLQYDFSAGDRIRFYKVLSGTTNTIYTTQDFEIQSQVLSPTINGEDIEGQFIKIALPTTSGTFDFGSNNFQNYFIELYTPAKSVAEGLDKYFEFSERYTIGNWGTSTAFHQGMTQNQTSNLATPALFEFTQGDYYYRNRTINTGGELEYVINAGAINSGRHTMGVTFSDRDFTDATITTGNSPLQNLSGWTFASDTRALIKTTAGAVTTRFKAKGTIIVDAADDDTYYFFFQDNTGAITYVNAIRGIAVGKQTFTIDCSFQLTASQHISFLGWSDSDYTNQKTFFQTDLKITIERPYTVGVVDPNFSDFFPSAVNSNGRPSIVDINAAQIFKGGLLRWGLEYLKDTNINQTNRFREVNFDDIPTDNGDIVLLDADGQELRVVQQMAVGRKSIYGKIIQDSGGENTLTTTDDILAKNNITYYENKHGIGNQPLSFIKSRHAAYFIDPVVGEQIRLSPAGLDSISVQNKGQFYIKSLLSKYNSEYLRTNGSVAKIIQHFDYFEDQCMTMMQAGTLSGEAIENNNLALNEKRNAYASFADLNYEMAISAGDFTYFWKAGQMYIQNDRVNRCRFFGTQFYPSITMVFNDQVAVKKKYLSLGYQSNVVWASPTNGDINTSTINPQTNLRQISQLKDVDFTLEETIQTAALWFDANSRVNPQEGLLNGDFLGGNWLEMKLTYGGSGESYLYLPYITWLVSNRNF